MDYHNCPNLAAMFFAEAARRGDRPFLWAKRGGAYRALSWSAARKQVTDLAKGLRALGIGGGDRVVLVAENRPEWIIADFAIMAAGAITVPAYTTHTAEDYRHVMTNCAAKAVIVSTAALARRVLPAAAQSPGVGKALIIEPAEDGQPSRVELRSWQAVLELGAAASGAVEDWTGAVGRNDIACLIYTSGTGGTPKGVMTTHGNILANCRSAFALLEKVGLGHEVFLSFLPLSHSYEHTAGMMFPISLGAEIYFAEGAETLAANLLEARPTIMTAVPRLYEAFHQRILRAVERDGRLKAKLFFRALALGLKRYERPNGLGFIERLEDAMLQVLVRRKLKARFGGRLKAMVSGGAALNPEIGRFFLALGLRLLQGYGQTEAAPVISANPPDRIKIDTVGLPVVGVEIGFADDGEILVRGDNVMKGYWNDPEATARALDGGWLHTGDVGRLDSEGFLVITDRKKDFIKTSGGEMVAPARIEGCLTLQPEIGQAMVGGDRKPYLVAVVVPSQHLVDEVAGRRELPPEARLADVPEIRQAVTAAVARVNETLAPFERIRRFIVADEPFTTANHQMTPTLKIRRHVIRHVYGEALAALYEKAGG
ncbi:MAG: long-chain fatty acid--CoA ligase [Alphaproteobacteria bacterium]|nr:long-chain fatty acid--CoA ligase [Alphaproteobacteria bacterium]